MLRSEEKVIFLGTNPCKQVCWVNMDQILPNPAQPRQAFDEKSIAELADSIAQFGLLQPIAVRALTGGQYELIAGERRMRACRRLGMTHIDAIVTPASPQDSALLALIENLQREDLHFFEEAEGFVAVLRKFGLAQEELASRVGKSQPYIANKIRLLRLDVAARGLIWESGLSERHARALLKLADEEKRLGILKQAIELGLTVRQVEVLVDQAIDRQKGFMNLPPRKVITLVRDHRLYINAIRDIISQMQKSGITADYTLTDLGDRIEMRVTMPRRRA